jgi:hypothetical protein
MHETDEVCVRKERLFPSHPLYHSTGTIARAALYNEGVGMTLGYGLDNPAVTGYFPLLNTAQTGTEAHPASFLICTGGGGGVVKRSLR